MRVSRRSRALFVGALGLVASATAGQASAAILVHDDPVLYWTQQAAETLPGSTPLHSRALAMVTIAIHDAVNATTGSTHQPYLTGVSAQGGDTRAAAAQAARDVLVALNPANTANYDAALSASLSLVPDGAAKSQGVATGASYAAAMLANRAADGSAASLPYVPTGEPGDWQPTPPALAPGALPHWGAVRPFLMQTGDQFRPGPPPALDSAAYAQAFDEVKSLGAFASAARTADQTAAAQFWATGSASLAWTRIALGLAETDGMSVLDHARTLALLSSVLADSQIAGFDSKYEYRFWRPVTAIRLADIDGNALTAADPTWTSLVTTPAFPAYVSTHSVLSRAAAVTLGSIYGDNPFCLTLGAGTRCFDDVDAAALDASNSRVWGGIHFRFDTDAGLVLGEQLGNYAVSGDFLRTVPEPSTWATMILGFGLLGAAARRARRRSAVGGLALGAAIAALITGSAAQAAVVTISSATLASNPGSYGPLDAAGTTLNVDHGFFPGFEGSLAVSANLGFEGLRIGANDDDGLYEFIFSNPITYFSMLVNSMSTIPGANVSEVIEPFFINAPSPVALDFTNIQYTAWDGSVVTSGPLDNGAFLLEATAAPGESFTVVSFFHHQTGNANGSVVRQIQYELAGDGTAVPEPTTWAMMLLGLAGFGGMVRRRRRDVAAAGAAS